ncbi:AraC family transcriptional regulator [Cohnella fermenti]|uniref:Helix-turn-helix domain-containing protein n=1 Tax=Cohnella fermenti TaxID=2565925 RepID=A0A4S4C830_9BACL|nr:helix-turn-helix domain-containing protein [Cohnella fermenti]THF84162.1 helix-turn-helix domain-containing protein [Cohnella fermenti]
MTIPCLRAERSIDRDVQAHYRLIESARQATPMHTHDFCEIFLVVEGSVVHCVNGARQTLEANTLVFVRDTDVHGYECSAEGEGQFLNFSFYKKTLGDLLDYLGEEQLRRELLAAPMPPTIHLAEQEGACVQRSLEGLDLTAAADKGRTRIQVRALLAELIVRYVAPALQTTHEHPDSVPPVWLASLCAAVRHERLFLEGVPALLQMSGKSHAYLCRAFKKHLRCSPVEYINDLRLSYAAELLATTDWSVTDVCLEAGFDHISHFGRLFKRKFRLTPRAYGLHRRSL